MSSDEQPTRERRKSRLSEDDMWEVSAKPKPQPVAPVPAPPAADPAPAVPPPATVPAQRPLARADARPRVGRGHTRDLAEARGRKRSRDAAYAWAAAAAKALERETECADELDAALRRGTDLGMLATYIREACDRYGLDPHHLPTQLRDKVGPTQ